MGKKKKKPVRKRKEPTKQRRRVARGKPRRCKHTGRAVAIIGVDVEAYACRKCDAAGIRPVGPANNDPPEVQIEIRAAELALWHTVDGIEEFDLEMGEMTVGEYNGWQKHIDTASHSVYEEQEAGWQAREVAQANAASSEQMNHDPGAWAWDISRPLAEQLAETAADDAAADDLVFIPALEVVLTDPAADDAAADALEPWFCPVESNECEIRRQCTNKCGRKDPAAQADREEASAAANTAALVADLDAKGPAWNALNDAFDVEDADLQAGGPALTTTEEVALFLSTATTATTAADCPEHPGADANDDGDCMECLAEILAEEDAADQAVQDGYDGAYVVVRLIVEPEPESVTCAMHAMPETTQ